MAFHFDARADSSDEDTPALDLSSWKNRAAGSTNNAPRPAPAPAPAPAPVAPMVVNHDAEDSDSDNSTPDLAAFQASDRKRKRPSATPSPVVPSFQAINSASKRPDGQSTFDLGSDDGTPDPALQLPASEDEDQEEEEVARPAEQKRLMVVVSRKEGKRRKNYRDLRAGDDNVRRVLKESQEQDGTVMYKVLFDDFHVENVSLAILLPAFFPLARAVATWAASPQSCGFQLLEAVLLGHFVIPRTTSLDGYFVRIRVTCGPKLVVMKTYIRLF